jgi:hypothetical protein
MHSYFDRTCRLSEQVVKVDAMHCRQWECDCEVQASIAWITWSAKYGYVIPNPICCQKARITSHSLFSTYQQHHKTTQSICQPNVSSSPSSVPSPELQLAKSSLFLCDKRDRSLPPLPSFDLQLRLPQNQERRRKTRLCHLSRSQRRPRPRSPMPRSRLRR